MLTSLYQKVSSRITFFVLRLHGQSAAGRWAGSNPEIVIYSELGKPKSLPLETTGKPTVRKAEWDVGMRLRKKRRLPCNEGDKD
jgi:hypothetical protein